MITNPERTVGTQNTKEVSKSPQKNEQELLYR